MIRSMILLLCFIYIAEYYFREDSMSTKITVRLIIKPQVSYKELKTKEIMNTAKDGYIQIMKRRKEVARFKKKFNKQLGG